MKVEGVVFAEERVRIPLGWLIGGVPAMSAYDGLGLPCLDAREAMPSPTCCWILYSSFLIS